MYDAMTRPNHRKRPTGAALARARHVAGLSPAQIAARLGVTRQRVANLELQAAVTHEAAARVLSAIAELVREREATTSGRVAGQHSGPARDRSDDPT